MVPVWREPPQPFRIPPVLAGAFTVGVLLLLVGPGRRTVRARLVALPTTRAAGLVIVLVTATWPVRLAAQCGPQEPAPDEVTHYHLGLQGSVLAVTGAAGAVLRQIRYEAYGEIRGRFNGGGATVSPSERYRHEYTAWETDLGTSLEYAGARYYDPAVGQFLTHDPAGQFASPYALGPGDPVNFADPTGAVGESGGAAATGVHTGVPSSGDERELPDPASPGDGVDDSVRSDPAGVEEGSLLQDATLEDLAERTPEVMRVAADQSSQDGSNPVLMAGGVLVIGVLGFLALPVEAAAATAILIVVTASVLGGLAFGAMHGPQTMRQSEKGEKSVGHQVKDIKAEVTEGVTSRGDDTPRSGEAGSLDKKVGAELIRRGNQQPKGPLRDALKKEGQRLIDRGRGKSHKTER